MVRKIKVYMRNGNVFSQKVTLDDKSLAAWVKMGHNIPDIGYLKLGPNYLNPKEISSLAIVKPWWWIGK